MIAWTGSSSPAILGENWRICHYIDHTLRNSIIQQADCHGSRYLPLPAAKKNDKEGERNYLNYFFCKNYASPLNHCHGRVHYGPFIRLQDAADKQPTNGLPWCGAWDNRLKEPFFPCPKRHK
jgi:hypothetical protein